MHRRVEADNEPEDDEVEDDVVEDDEPDDETEAPSDPSDDQKWADSHRRSP